MLFEPFAEMLASLADVQVVAFAFDGVYCIRLVFFGDLVFEMSENSGLQDVVAFSPHPDIN